MIPKFNKQTGRWGVWIDVKEADFAVWMSNIHTDDIPGEPLRFQSKQEAAARIESLREAK